MTGQGRSCIIGHRHEGAVSGHSLQNAQGKSITSLDLELGNFDKQ